MSRIAVDAVLLPSEEVVAAAISANRELLKQCPDEIVLDKDSYLPHISLAMGCIDQRDLVCIERILQSIAEKRPPGHLVTLGISVGTNSVGQKVSVLELERTESLQSLHEEIMRGLAPHFSYQVTAEMVFSPPAAAESTLLWIRNYPEKSSFGRFFPHITLGYGHLDDFSFPPKFTALRLALCHLGNHCTCRRILASVQLPH